MPAGDGVMGVLGACGDGGRPRVPIRGACVGVDVACWADVRWLKPEFGVLRYILIPIEGHTEVY